MPDLGSPQPACSSRRQTCCAAGAVTPFSKMSSRIVTFAVRDTAVRSLRPRLRGRGRRIAITSCCKAAGGTRAFTVSMKVAALSLVCAPGTSRADQPSRRGDDDPRTDLHLDSAQRLTADADHRRHARGCGKASPLERETRNEGGQIPRHAYDPGGARAKGT